MSIRDDGVVIMKKFHRVDPAGADYSSPVG